MMQTIMKKNLALVPAVLLSSALLLTACSSGNPAANNNPSNPSSSTSSSNSQSAAPGSSPAPTLIQGHVDAPQDMTREYKSFYHSPSTLSPEGWEIYKPSGATTYLEDPAERATTSSDWSAAKSASMSSKENLQKFQKMAGEMSSDVDQSAVNISTFLEKNPSATLDSIKSDKSLFINRYPNVGVTDVFQDSSTHFYFVIFTPKDNKLAPHGILVPQAGKTPDFDNQTPPGL